MQSSTARGLPQLRRCLPHKHVLSVAGGGPSLADTRHQLTGYIAAINGSLKYLLSQPVIEGSPYFCGVVDAGEHIADGLVADKNVRYYVASICDPSVFDKLSDCEVVLWHVTPQSTGDKDGASAILDRTSPNWLAVGGGCTMGLRWLNLGYLLGFRDFRLHGLDSSFRDGATHAYPDRTNENDHFKVGEHWTRANFVEQVSDFFKVMNTFKSLEPTNIEVLGSGLLQDTWKKWGLPKAAKDTAPIRAKEVLSRLPAGPVCGAEIGVFSGLMSAKLLKREDLFLTMVDAWTSDQYRPGSSDWHATLTEGQQLSYMNAAISVTSFAWARRDIIRSSSTAAARAVEDKSLDFVFIDAEHTYEACLSDIRAWEGKIKMGGLLCGHDYDNPQFDGGVKAAVDEYAAGREVELGEDFTWFIRL